MHDDKHLKKIDGVLSLKDENLTPEGWVALFCAIHRIEYHYKTNSVLEAGEAVDSQLCLSKMRLLAHNLAIDGLKSMLADAFAIWRKDQERKFITSLRSRFAYQKSKTDLLAEWVQAATGKQDALDIAMVRHFIWQVKRKLFSLPVEWHTMIVLCGPSGIGKSVAVHELLKPLDAVTLCRDMTVFADQFSRRQFTRNFIMFMDEMAKSQQTDINALKNIVTAPTVSWRGMNSESVHSGPQNCTFIAASNHPVRDRIQDPTSARRFWELKCAARLDWETINSIDYEALWRSVDEKAECPIKHLLPEIQRVQERELRSKDMIEQWLEHSCAPVPFSQESPTTEILYGHFKKWCQWQGIAHYPGVQLFSRGLTRRIEALGWSATSRHTNRGTTWSLKVKDIEVEAQAAV